MFEVLSITNVKTQNPDERWLYKVARNGVEFEFTACKSLTLD